MTTYTASRQKKCDSPSTLGTEVSGQWISCGCVSINPGLRLALDLEVFVVDLHDAGACSTGAATTIGAVAEHCRRGGHSGVEDCDSNGFAIAVAVKRHRRELGKARSCGQVVRRENDLDGVLDRSERGING